MTNPRLVAKFRRMTPLGSSHEMGSHKGYGLAAMVEILTAVLPGLRQSQKTSKPEAHVGHFFLVSDPRRFRDEGDFEADLDAMMDALRDSKPVELQQPVLVAGDPEYAAAGERERTGIPVSRRLVEDIRGFGKFDLSLIKWTGKAKGFAPFG